MPAVDCVHSAKAAGAAADGAGRPGGAGGVQVLTLCDITPTRRSRLKEQRRNLPMVKMEPALIRNQAITIKSFLFVCFNVKW